MLEMLCSALYLGSNLLLIALLLLPAIGMVVVTLLCFLSDGIGWFRRRRTLL
ncbi:hypothetical protein [Pseudoflavonifractor phocaeensis]|uniref:hypothetical protein n=1 Tax=Pseudoflavonifractor phocaeensis TaxID=1870988 RepID=UPI001F46A607|nr:hypothetical protein [Pseudoflavonifractor phocaeensis]MCF2662394.1 hypothetical protein [Pseudoflavonifractor phocaeensis]